MKWLLAGGSGRIGSALTVNLLEDGHEVSVLTRKPNRSATSPKLTYLNWDGRSLGDWAEAVNHTDVIVNLAGARLAGANPLALRWTGSRKRLLCESRKWAGQALCAAISAAERPPGALLQMSGIDYYPVQDEIAREDTPAGEDFLSYICSDCWESATAEVEELGVRRVILRTGPTLALILPPMALQSRLFVGGPLGDGRQWVSWVHMPDVVRAIRFVAEEDQARGPFNLCAPNPVRNEQLSRSIGTVLSRPSFFKVPAFLMRLAFGEMADTLLLGVRAMPFKLLETGFDFQFGELELALRDYFA